VTGKENRGQVRLPAFSYRSVKPDDSSALLNCDRVSLAHLAKRFGTPLYVYSASTIRERMRAFDRAFHKVPHTVCYSVKASSNLSILRLLARMGCGFDVVSGGELERVLRVSRSAARKVVFSGVGKTPDEMRAALKAEVLLFNVESESELLALAECAAGAKKKARIALRVNPDVPAETHPYISTGLHQHKFGIPIDEARRLYARAAEMKFLEVGGVSVHIGSQITDVKPFAATMERVAELTRALRTDGYAIRYVDAGGGLGIAYENQGGPGFADCVASYADALLRPLRNLKVHLLLEPGRCIVAPAGALLTRLLYKKTNGAKKFLVVDAAMNDLVRPSLYRAYHEVVPVEMSDKSEQSARETVDVVGPICETGDFFARDRELPVMQEGDLLALLDAGAYGMVLASNYNTRPRPAEVLVDGKSVKVIRRRETIADLVRGER
jgi:diaminopimelate decarboxylase